MRGEFKEFERLVEKYVSEGLTKEELKKLNLFLIEEKNKRHFKKMLSLNYALHRKWLKVEDSKKEELFAKIIKQPKIRTLNPYKKLLRIAAVFAVIAGGSLLYLFSPFTPEKPQINFVTLDLHDGTNTILKEGSTLVISENKHVRIEQRGDTLSYTNTQAATGEINYDEIHVPNGKTSIVKLADGTIINLNAGSTLRYPDGFRADENREVYLRGEGYFQVAHDVDHPFLVHTDPVDVRVLGTTFNLNAYPDAEVSNTVLIAGKVAISAAENPDKTALLEPGMLGSYSKESGKLSTAVVKLDVYTAWVRDQLYFEETNFAYISKVLERKFDVTISITNENLKDEKFTAKFKEENLEEILKSFTQSYDFKYAIKGNTVVIK